MFSFQTLHVLCEFRKFLPKYRIMWPMILFVVWNKCVRQFVGEILTNYCCCSLKAGDCTFLHVKQGSLSEFLWFFGRQAIVIVLHST